MSRLTIFPESVLIRFEPSLGFESSKNVLETKERDEDGKTIFIKDLTYTEALERIENGDGVPAMVKISAVCGKVPNRGLFQLHSRVKKMFGLPSNFDEDYETKLSDRQCYAKIKEVEGTEEYGRDFSWTKFNKENFANGEHQAINRTEGKTINIDGQAHLDADGNRVGEIEEIPEEDSKIPKETAKQKRERLELENEMNK